MCIPATACTLPEVAALSLVAVVLALAAVTAATVVLGSVWLICDDDNQRFLLLFEDPPPALPVHTVVPNWPLAT
jgi:hypothetical protein